MKERFYYRAEEFNQLHESYLAGEGNQHGDVDGRMLNRLMYAAGIYNTYDVGPVPTFISYRLVEEAKVKYVELLADYMIKRNEKATPEYITWLLSNNKPSVVLAELYKQFQDTVLSFTITPTDKGLEPASIEHTLVMRFLYAAELIVEYLNGLYDRYNGETLNIDNEVYTDDSLYWVYTTLLLQMLEGELDLSEYTCIDRTDLACWDTVEWYFACLYQLKLGYQYNKHVTLESPYPLKLTENDDDMEEKSWL